MKPTWDTSSTVDQSKDHTTKSPSNSLNTHRRTQTIRPFKPHNSQDCYVQKQESSHKLSNSSSVKRPWWQFPWFKQRSWWWLFVILVCLSCCPQWLSFPVLVCSKINIFFFVLCHFFFLHSLFSLCVYYWVLNGIQEKEVRWWDKDKVCLIL